MSMLFKRIKDWATNITAFRTGDVIPVDGPDGTAKMSKDDLLKETEKTSSSLQLVDGNRQITNQAFFELGGVTFLSSGFVYGTDNRRIRTPQDKPIHLSSGDVVGLTDYSVARFYIGWVDSDGNYKYSNGWKSQDFTCCDEGDYTIMIAHSPDGSALSNPFELSQYFVQPSKRKAYNLFNIDPSYTNEAIGFNVFEMGQIVFSSTWSYHLDYRRVRTKEGIGIKYKAGDIIGLTDYTNARFYVGWIDGDGVSHYSSGWKTADYTCTQDGMYSIMIAHKTEDPNPSTIELTSVTELSHLWKNRTDVVFDTLSKEIKKVDDKVDDCSTILSEATEDLFDYENVTEPKEFVVGTTSSVFYPNNHLGSVNRLVTTDIIEVFPGSNVVFDCGSNYDFVLFSSSSSDEASNWQDSGWKVGGTTIAANNRYVKIIVRCSSSHPSGFNADMTTADVEYINGCNLSYSKLVVEKRPYGFAKFERAEKISNSFSNPFKDGQIYYYHLGLDKSGNDVIIPSQSLADVDMAFRLGFKVYEANSLKCADGNIMMHGSSTTKFRANCVLDENDDYANDVNVGNLTLSEIESDYRYKSKYAHYETKLTEYVEGLRAVKSRGMIPFISFNTSNADELRNDVKKVFGNDYIAYQGNVAKDNAMIMKWSSLSTKQAILEECETIGAPYLHMPTTEVISQWMKDVASEFAGETIANVSTYFDSLTFENQILLIEAEIDFFKDLSDAVHEKGCLIGWAASYCDEQTTQMLRLAGWDASAAKNQVNDFGRGNVFSYELVNSLDGISTSGVLEDGVLKLTSATYVRKKDLSPVFMAKAVLKIRFVGTLFIQLYGSNHNKFVSDGSKEFVISTYFLDTTPGFDIYNTAAAQILELSFNVSTC